ncbi:cobalamin B12-binding domain-containing protein [Thiorhodococcus fuscus]|uniref:B12-binding domain-containing protein n=1 Tax=Thiorhodococcus fuscus TaxID=527200 RepID=A0ABW4Y859_9GAMM
MPTHTSIGTDRTNALTNRIAALIPCPPGAAQLYAERADALASQVSNRLANHPQIAAFLNGNPFRLLEVNHRNHAALVAGILRTNDFALLTRVLSWSYHAYHGQGVPYEYFLARNLAWKEAIQAQLPELERHCLLNLYDWILDAHQDIIDAAESYRIERPEIPQELHEAYAAILESLLAGDHLSALEHGHRLLDNDLPFPKLLQYIVYPAMFEVGERWENGDVSVAMEHQATSTAYLMLSTLYYTLPFPAAHRGEAIVAPVTNEFHELGAWMVSACLELDGWNVTLLPGDTTLEGITEAARRISPRFVALSISLPSNVPSARKIIETLRASLPAESDTRILIGGRALLTAPSLAEWLGADLSLPDCESAVDWARTLPSTA